MEDQVAVWQFAKLLQDVGISHCPTKPNDKAPCINWKDLQGGVLNAEDPGCIDAYKRCGRIGIICGHDLHIEVIDFDDPSVFPLWLAMIPPELYAILYVESSPSGGIHVIYCCVAVEGNQKLAWNADGTKARIETRGRGGFIVVAPSPGYVKMQGDLTKLTTISPEQRKVLLDAAKSFDIYVPPPKPDRPDHGVDLEKVRAAGEFKRTPKNWNGKTVAEDYSERADIEALLSSKGWSYNGEGKLGQEWTRPNKSSGVSGTLFDTKVFYCFSSSAAPLKPSTAYSPVQLYAEFHHNGDVSTACKELYRNGYGDRQNNLGPTETPSAFLKGVWGTTTIDGLINSTVLPIPTAVDKDDQPSGTIEYVDDSAYEVDRPAFVGPTFEELMYVLQDTPEKVYIEETMKVFDNVCPDILFLDSLLLAGMSVARDGTYAAYSENSLKLRTNVYGLKLINSGKGKGITSGVMRLIMEKLDLKEIKGVSEAAICGWCEEIDGARYGLHYKSEISKLLNAKDILAQQSINFWLEVFNLYRLEWITKPKSGKVQKVLVDPAAPSLLVEGQQELFENVAVTAQLNTGFLARFLPVVPRSKDKVRLCGVLAYEKILDAYSGLRKAKPFLKLPNNRIITKMDAFAKHMTVSEGAFYSKLSEEYLLKIACMLSPMSVQEGFIPLELLYRSGVVAEFFFARAQIICGSVHSNEPEAQRKKMEQYIAEHPGCTDRDLYRVLGCNKFTFEKDYAETVFKRGGACFEFKPWKNNKNKKIRVWFSPQTDPSTLPHTPLFTKGDNRGVRSYVTPHLNHSNPLVHKDTSVLSISSNSLSKIKFDLVSDKTQKGMPLDHKGETGEFGDSKGLTWSQNDPDKGPDKAHLVQDSDISDDLYQSQFDEIKVRVAELSESQLMKYKRLVWELIPDPSVRKDMVKGMGSKAMVIETLLRALDQTVDEHIKPPDVTLDQDSVDFI